VVREVRQEVWSGPEWQPVVWVPLASQLLWKKLASQTAGLLLPLA